LLSDQSVFSFDLNETLFFEKGQEVAEIKGISLDPDISIQPFHDYISIRGVIELTGEYKKVDSKEEEDNSINLEDLQAKRYIERVIDLEDNDAEFVHRFPVEISVPSYRVNNLNDVMVSIEAFDYEFPDESQLKLYSTIQIYGINSEDQADYKSEGERKEDSDQGRTSVLENEEEAEQETFTTETNSDSDVVLGTETSRVQQLENEPVPQNDTKPNNDTEDTLQFRNDEADSLGSEEEPEAEYGESREPVEDIENTFEFEVVNKEGEESASEQESENLEIAKDGEKTDPDRWPFKEKSQTLAEFFGNASSKPEVTVSDDSLDEQHSESGMDDSPDIYESSESRSESVEDVSYLSDIFRNPEENSYTKMRICIVQNEDTIETIAERFQVSPLQLIKQNQLEEDFDVEPGQLLYIPYKK